ncbi:MAG: fibrobacter succinogenes major paralogous domain-containing protein [Ekhidna sp.]|uniref:fibrobacter succinogenes major paralogous domain-containing protein n=1 Tax=Ekhidna sp. TaxID=2608089 RepID=UPI0032EB8D54
MHFILRTTITLLALCFLFFACSSDNSPSEEVGKISFSLSVESGNSGRINESSLANAVSILITIETSEGEPTEYDRETIDLYEVNGQFISEKISLTSGSYDLIEFFLIDSENNVTHIAPMEGSSQAQNVSDPLPIQFQVNSNEVTELLVEVIATDGLDAEDFGLVGFNLTEVPVFSFLINISEKGDLESFLDGKLSISAINYQFESDLIAIAGNPIIIKDGLESYELEITSEGYHSFNNTFTQDSLKNHNFTPLTIEIERISIPGEDLTDSRDGKTYKTIHLGTQQWMAENLQATLYNDGSPIDYPGTNISEWEENTAGAYAWYDYTETEYGPLYNWYAANTGKLCPVGWHIPSDEEWNTLAAYLGGGSIAGAKMKEKGTDHWDSPNSDATNESGFSALPAGWAYFANGHFSYLGERAIFWSSEEGFDSNHGISRHIRSEDPELIRYMSSNSSNKRNGFSCRCIKD